MQIKIKESLRTIKTRDRAKNLAQNTRNGASELKEYVEDAQNVNYESENEYAGSQMQSAEERVIRTAARKVEKIGKWGVREIRQNFDHWRNSPKKSNVNGAQKKLLSTQRKALQFGTKQTVKVTEKAVKETAKATKRAAQAAKKVVQTTVKTVKITVKAIISTIKAVAAGIKALVAAIAAGGWVAVVIVVLICAVALIAGSIYAVFVSDETGGNIKISQVVKSLDAEYASIQDDLLNQYSYDECIFEGEKTDWRDVIAVYAVKLNLDPENPQEVATFDEEKSTQLREIFWDMNSFVVNVEEWVETEMHAETQDDGSVIEVQTKVTKIYLHIVSVTVSVNEIADMYNFTQKQRELLSELTSGVYDSQWDELIK